MSDTSGLPNTNAEGVPAEDQPERFEGGEAQEHDAQAAEPAETEAGQAEAEQERTAPEGAEDVTVASTTGSDAAEPPPADFDPAQQPSNPDLVDTVEPPD